MQGKVALVTGASRGIGAACALELGRRGFRVAIHYRSGEDKARAVLAELPKEQGQLFRYDLTEATACADLIKAVKDHFGGLDVLVNNAGIAIDQILPFAKPEDFDVLVATNLRPVFLLAKNAAKGMMRQKSGRVINMSSVVGHTGNGGQSMYAATKAAITGFTKSIAQELAPFGVLCNCVAPGFIETDMTEAIKPEARAAILTKVPMQRLGKPSEVAAAVAFLASEDASYITGSTIHVNGGMFTN